jgi:peptidoglycan/LPS O-acetylase OafA/YrhL
VEVVFYCALPILVLAARRLALRAKDRRGRVLVLLGPPLLLLALGLSGKFTAAYILPGPPTDGWQSDWHSVVERSFWAQADLFSFGMIVAVIHTEVADGRILLTTGRRRLAGLLGLFMLGACAATMDGAELSYVPQNTGTALGLALLLAAIVLPDFDRARQPLVLRILETRFIVAVGVVSYSLFLWHNPLIDWLNRAGLTGSGRLGLLLNLAVVAVLSGTFSALTYWFIEEPALRRKALGLDHARDPRAA